MRHLLLAAVASLGLATACAQASPPVPAVPTYKVEPTHASLTWKVNHQGLSLYTARFTQFDATLTFDPANPAASTLSATVNPLSVRTDYSGDFKATHANSPYASWDEALARDPKWFNADAHPAITFNGTGITVTGENTGTVTGDLTFLGVTKPVTLNVRFNGEKEFPWNNGAKSIGFSATGTIKRSEFGMATMLGGLGDDVEIALEVEFLQQVPAAG